MSNQICSHCGKDPTSFCYCGRKDTFLCDDCIQKHHLQFRTLFHQICPLSAFPDHTVPGYYDRLSIRTERMTRGKEQLQRNIDKMNVCLSELNRKEADIMEVVAEHMERTIAQISEKMSQISAAIQEADATIYCDKPVLHNELTLKLRDFGASSQSLQLFDYVIDPNPYPSSLESIVQFTQGLNSTAANEPSSDGSRKIISDLERELTELRLKHEETIHTLQSVQKECKAKAEQCATMEQIVEALNQEDQDHQLAETLMDATQKNSELEARLRMWGITSDPPIEAQNPVPDFCTPQSRAALIKFGPYPGQDEELILVKRGPVLLTTGVYTGQWNSKEEPHGYGKLVNKQGVVYEGQWRNGVMTGLGRFIWPNGDVYIGELVHGYCKGMGIKYFNNGEVHSGMWVNDKLHGVGSIKFREGTQYTHYFGEFVEYERTGRGAAFGKDGNLYAGDWVHNMGHGKGVNVWSTGVIYMGDWERDMKSGIGCLVTTNGRVIQGLWKDDQMCDQ